MNMDRLEQAWNFTQRCTQNGGLLVVRKGHLVFEDYFGRASRKVNPDRASTGKAYTSIACGIMLKEFHDQIPDGPDTKVFTPRFLLEAFSPDGRLDDERRADITLGQLLCMTGGYNGQYDPSLTNVPQPEPDHSRDDWKPIPSTPFNERSLGGDDGIRRVLEMVCAAVRE